MKTMIFLISLLMAFAVEAQNLKPYILGAESAKTLEETKTAVKANLKTAGFEVVGEYQPAKDANRWLFVVTSADLKNVAAKEGGLAGFAMALRVGITKEAGKINVSYTNPLYWGNAYLGDDFTKYEAIYKKIDGQFMQAMKLSGTVKNIPFGSAKGLSTTALRDYQYMMGMPDFDDVVELGEFDSYQAAENKVEANLAKNLPGIKVIYRIELPNSELKLYGLALTSATGESSFLPTIDISSPKHTAFLPYEVLIDEEEVVMLHGRFRIAVAFPDLTMTTFTKIMSTPGSIEDTFEQLCK
jgi:uncharacterized protein (DUF302 family)